MDQNNNRNWTVLNWNIRGLNSDEKCNAIRSKIEESACSVFCIQETKRQFFDSSTGKKLAPKHFNKFAFQPSDGASGGIFIGSNGAIFTGNLIFSSKFAITVMFSSLHNADQWKLTVVYGPCHGQERTDFISWLNGIQIYDQENWMFIGDFNFYRSMENRNRNGGNIHDIVVFNEIISNLGLQEIPLKGRNYTWSNMQQDPLLEQLDW
jgi:exonuclease III